jgi:hypothetical protein
MTDHGEIPFFFLFIVAIPQEMLAEPKELQTQGGKGEGWLRDLVEKEAASKRKRKREKFVGLFHLADKKNRCAYVPNLFSARISFLDASQDSSSFSSVRVRECQHKQTCIEPFDLKACFPSRWATQR